VLGFYQQWNATTYYRMAVPFSLLPSATWVPLERRAMAHIQAADTLVLSRPAGPPEMFEQLMLQLKAHEKNLIIDVDDDVLHLPPTSVAYAPPDAGMVRAIKLADAVLVQNQELATVFGKINPRIGILPNLVRPDLWPARLSLGNQRPVIMLSGSATHYEDWYPVAPALARIKQSFDCEIIVHGFLPDYLQGIYTRYIPWTGFDAYPYVLNMADIGLCPLIDTHFNRCKSPIKAFEFALAGAAVVANPTQYASAGLADYVRLVRNDADWYDAISDYLANTASRSTDAAALQDYVQTVVDARRWQEQISAAYAMDSYSVPVPEMDAQC
jgi:hypothetical protein